MCKKNTSSKKKQIGSNKKLDLEWTMNGFENHFEKKIRFKISKNSKNQCEITAC